ncbi:MAG TPA: Crp/Fnr family transcriptional regulator [Terriglobia bacterium]|nr:Crp/Fnr family transcriptional regulator [Terriglobia bacterium]
MKDISHRPLKSMRAGILSSPAFATLERIETREIYPNGHKFFAQGQPASGVYLLYAGGVQLSIADGDGAELILGLATPGNILGLSATVSGKCHEETAEATTDCQAGFITGKDFLHFLGCHPEAAFRIVQVLSDRVAMAFEQLSSIQGGSQRRVPQ